MSLHSYTRVWLHLIWGTLERRPLLFGPAAAKTSAYLSQYAAEKGMYVKINYVNSDHVHVLLDLPTNLCIEEVVHFLKGGSSHWINETGCVGGRFAWGRGYGAFSVSHSAAAQVAGYIATQAEHHRRKPYAEELRKLIEKHELTWHQD